MSGIALIFLGAAVLMAVGVFRMGNGSGWHWGWATVAALVPIAFTLFLGILGLLISGAYFVSIWKVTT